MRYDALKPFRFRKYMGNHIIIVTIMFWQAQCYCFGQGTMSILNENADSNLIYLFYLHGGIVQEQGANAISKDFGPYEYHAILDSFKKQGFHVISEVRPRGTLEKSYALTVCRQMDSLLINGVSPKNIVVVGASQGGFITIEIANLMKNEEINYVILGACNKYNIKYYKGIRKKLCGNFLSIFESSDSKGSCEKLLGGSDCKHRFHELCLTMGNGHGFIFRPYTEWMLPIKAWLNETGCNQQ